MGLWDVVTDLAPSVIDAGLNIWGTESANNANKKASKKYQKSLNEAAGLLTAGETEALEYMLGGNEDMRRIYEAQRAAGKSDREALGIAYAQALTGAADIYGDALTEAGDAYSQRLRDTLAETLGEIDYGTWDSIDALNRGLAGLEDAYAPYLEGGEDAVAYLSQVMGRDASQLTPAQQRMMADQKDAMRANLAASGLRGAGRAGVASFNEGEAALRANLYDQNQRQIDQAVQALGQYGFGATGNVASARGDFAARKAGVLGDAANTRAGLIGDAGRQIADVGLNIGNTVGEARKSAMDRGHQTIASLREGNAQRDDMYAAIRAALAGSDASLRGGATKNIAGYGANALTGGAGAALNAGLANAANTQDMFGSLASIAANGMNKWLTFGEELQ